MEKPVMAVSNGNERRKHLRVGFSTIIKVQLDAEDGRIELEGSSKDLSLKGLFLDTDQIFKKGTRCVVDIVLTGTVEEMKLPIEGSIVRSGADGTAIEFDSMDVDTYSHLKNIVSYNKDRD